MVRGALWMVVGVGIGFGVAALFLGRSGEIAKDLRVSPPALKDVARQPPVLVGAPDAVHPIQIQLDAANQRIQDLEAEVRALQATSTAEEYAIPRWRDEMVAKLTNDDDSSRDLAELSNALALSGSALADTLIELNEADSDELLNLNWDWRAKAMERDLGVELPQSVLSRLREEFLGQWKRYREDVRTTWLDEVRHASTNADRARLERARGQLFGDLFSRLVFAARKMLASEGLDAKWEIVARYL